MTQIWEILKSYLSDLWEVIRPFVELMFLVWNQYTDWLPYNQYILLILLAIIFGLPIYFLTRKRKPKRPGRLKTGRDLLKEAKWAEKHKEFIRAGELYEMTERFSQAVKMFLQGNSPDRASRVYFERLNDPKSALSVLIESGLWEQAGGLCAKLQDFNLAGEFFEKANKLQSAAEMYEKAGQFSKAGVLFEKTGFIEESANCYGQAGDFKKAGELSERVWKEILREIKKTGSGAMQKKLEDLAKRTSYYFKQAGDLKKSAWVLEQSGIKKYSAELYLLAGDKKKAAELFMEMGEVDRAMELFEQGGDTQKAMELRAQFYLKQNLLKEAAECYEKAGDFLTSADLYLRVGDKKKAGKLYLEGGDSKTAADVFYSAGEYLLSAQAYEAVGNYDMAIQVYERLNDNQKLAQLYEKMGDYYQAGLNYHKIGQVDLALRALSQVSEKSSDFISAVQLIGDIYFEKKRFDQALNCYRRVMPKKPFGLDNLELYYRLAQIYEQVGQANYAFNLYQQIWGISPGYQDLGERIKNLQQKISTTAQLAVNPVMAGAGAVAQTGGFRYQMIKELGRGGMGVVYLAKDLNLQRQVALKVLPPEMNRSPDAVKNFIREAQNIAQLNNPYIVTLYDAGEYNQAYYLTMEYVEGENLRDLVVRYKKVPLSLGIEIFKQLALALDYAHSKRVIHRDIKPSNIMLTETQTIKVMDFGLAALFDEVRTAQTQVSGTPLYMSPEQMQGRPLDHRTDIYSMGIMMYELFTGSPPFPEQGVSYHQVHTPPRPPKELNPEIPDSLSRIIFKALAKDPSQRYQNARSVYLDLSQVKGG